MGFCGQHAGLTWNRREWDPSNVSVLYLADQYLGVMGTGDRGLRGAAFGNAAPDTEGLLAGQPMRRWWGSGSRRA